MARVFSVYIWFASLSPSLPPSSLFHSFHLFCPPVMDGYDIYHECQLSIDQVFDLAELCVEFMYELHDFYLDVSC